MRNSTNLNDFMLSTGFKNESKLGLTTTVK